jgi:pimeloyl-ACP methyl ester carboxylesterase
VAGLVGQRHVQEREVPAVLDQVATGGPDQRDLVLVDLRGTGKSAALTCPELARPDADGNFDSDLLSVPAVRACRARLEQTADLRLYTTEIAVDDLEEVRQALGYGPINVYGTSYGTRVAQHYTRRGGRPAAAPGNGPPIVTLT